MCYTLISKSHVELLNRITTDMTQEFSQVFVEADRSQYMHAKLQVPFASEKGVVCAYINVGCYTLHVNLRVNTVL